MMGMRFIHRLRLQEWIVLFYGVFLLFLRFLSGFGGFPIARLAFTVPVFIINQVLYVPAVIITYAREIPYYEVVFLLAGLVWIIRRVESDKPLISNMRVGTILRHFFPLALLVGFYEALTNYQQENNLVWSINKLDYTGFFIKCDEWIFGGQPSQLLEPYLNRAVTEIMYLVYGMYFVFPLILTYMLLKKGRDKDLNEFMLAVVILVTAGITIYFMFPGISPAYVLEYETELEGYFFADMFRYSMEETRSRETDCCVFPSVHVALSALVLYYSLKLQDRTKYLLGPAIILSWIATIYLRRHYFVDAIAGFILAAVVCAIAPKIQNWWDKK
jgi:hypothetical protein